MAKIKYREFLENLTNELGYTPGSKDLSKILEDVTANALNNRYSSDGNISSAEAERILNFYRNKNRLGNEREETIMLDYYPTAPGECVNGVFVPSNVKEMLVVPKKAFFTKFAENKNYSVFTMKGNTMEPLLMEGDRIIVEHYSGGQIVDNRPYLCCYNNEFFIRRLAKNVNQLVVMPENRMYDIIKLTKDEADDMTLIGQVVGLMRDLR